MDTHAQQVDDLRAAYARGENKRVPVTFASDEQLWLKVSGDSFREFYTKPDAHLRAQLQGKLWFSENVVCDLPPGLPDRWVIGVQNWMDENEFFGCEVVYQEDDYAWALPLDMERDDLLRHLSGLDPEDRIRRSSTFRMYQALKELAQGMEFEGRPVDVSRPGGGTHGIFTKAAEVRGLEQICLDMIDAPEFVDELLRIVAEKTIARIAAWHRIVEGTELDLPSAGGFGFADDSLQMISADAYERFVLPHHERLYSAMATGARSLHLCGRSSQHYESLRRKANVRLIDGPGPFIDHGRYLRELGPDFAFNAQTDHSILQRGSIEEIERMMRELMTPEAKLPGRFQILGYVARDTPIRNVNACYQAGRRYGAIQ